MPALARRRMQLDGVGTRSQSQRQLRVRKTKTLVKRERKDKRTTTKKTKKKTKKTRRRVDSDGNENLCRLCNEGGELLCCDGCPGAFHPKCLGMKSVPEGDWYCSSCTKERENTETETETETEIEIETERTVEKSPSFTFPCLWDLKPLAPKKDEGNGNGNGANADAMSYEEERQKRILANREKMSKLVGGVQKSIIQQLNAKTVKRVANRQPRVLSLDGKVERKGSSRRAAIKIASRPNTRQKSKTIRTSNRLKGATPEFEGFANEYVESERDGRIILDHDVVNKNSKKDEEHMKRLLAQRCNSKGRGSLYDPKVGITCHFCRQKKLCGEPGCPRCSTRSVTKECIGKSECQRCHSATGQFCRACLLIRYGLVLEDVRKEMEAGTWLCPHCYEEDHPHKGWICNSSICMTRRGLAPTGIAIYEAQERGFASVAHYVQAKLLKGKRCIKY